MPFRSQSARPLPYAGIRAAEHLPQRDQKQKGNTVKKNTLALNARCIGGLILAAATTVMPATLRAASCGGIDPSRVHLSYAPSSERSTVDAALGKGATVVTDAQPAEPITTDTNFPAPLVNVVGLWKVTYYDGQGNVVDVAFEVWHSDFTEILNDYTPPAEGNVCLGTFAPAGIRSYRLTHPAWLFDSNGNLTGNEILHVSVTLDRTSSTMTGTYSIDFFDPAGNPQGSFTGGTLKGTRINP